MTKWFALVASVFLIQTTAHAKTSKPATLEEFDPSAPNAEQILEEFDKVYEQETGESSHPFGRIENLDPAEGCFRESCAVWAYIRRSEQRLYLLSYGRQIGTWLISSGTGNKTPNFDRHPDGRMYKKYTSKAHPGGDWMGLGNMPYAVFIQGGYAHHGTPKANWKKLGTKASHGCIRAHPDNGSYFFDLVSTYGIQNAWITVTE
jgi:hypothetical protein